MTCNHQLVTLIWVGALHIAFRQNLVTSWIKSCVNSWRISVRRLDFVNCMHPPAILNQLLGENHQGAVILMGMTRRSSFQEGEGGFSQNNHLQLLLQYNQREDGLPRDHLFSPYFLMFGRQPHLPVDITLGLASCTITEPNTSKFVQKIWKCTWWAQQKAEAFQTKEVQ